MINIFFTMFIIPKNVIKIILLTYPQMCLTKMLLSVNNLKYDLYCTKSGICTST